MKGTKLLCCLILLCAGFINGCGSVDGLNRARRAAEIFFEDRFENGGAGSDQFYSKVFWDNTDPTEWRNIKKLVDLSLGELQSYTLVSWNLKEQLPTSQLPGTFAVLVFKTEYEKGSGHEKLTLLQRSGWAEFEIVGHQIDSQQINEMVLDGIAKVAEQRI
jgi:hypothetical protein